MLSFVSTCRIVEILLTAVVFCDGLVVVVEGHALEVGCWVVELDNKVNSVLVLEGGPGGRGLARGSGARNCCDSAGSSDTVRYCCAGGSGVILSCCGSAGSDRTGSCCDDGPVLN